MACPPKPSAFSLFFFLLLVLLPLAHLTIAGRPLPSPNSSKTQTQSTPNNKRPTQANTDKKHTVTHPGNNQTGKTNLDKKQTECLDQEGSALIPGIGRYMPGSTPALPTFGGTFLGDSVPASLNGQYLPGFDDTFVPNPGYEVPNPARGVVVP